MMAQNTTQAFMISQTPRLKYSEGRSPILGATAQASAVKRANSLIDIELDWMPEHKSVLSIEEEQDTAGQHDAMRAFKDFGLGGEPA